MTIQDEVQEKEVAKEHVVRTYDDGSVEYVVTEGKKIGYIEHREYFYDDWLVF